MDLSLRTFGLTQFKASKAFSFATTAVNKGVIAAANADLFVNNTVRKAVSKPLQFVMNKSAQAKSLVEYAGRNRSSLVNSVSTSVTAWTGVALFTKYSFIYGKLPGSAQGILDGALKIIHTDWHETATHSIAVTALIGTLRIASACLLEAEALLPQVKEETFTSQFEHAPTLAQLERENSNVQTTLKTLETRLKEDKAFLNFLGFDYKSFSIIDVLGSSKILESTDIIGDSSVNRAYDNLNACTVISLANQAVLSHELLHLLHFQALKRKMDEKTICKVLNVWNKQVPKEFLEYENVSKNLEILKNKIPEQKPSESEQQAAMELFVLFAEITGHADYLEAIASRYRYADNSWNDTASDLLMLSLYPATVAVSLLGGCYFLNRQLNARLGYIFPKYVNRYFGSGLIDSVLM